MKRTYLLTFVFVLVFGQSTVLSQLPNQNTYLLKNLNTRPEGGIYSACWGYRAPNGREYAILGCYHGTQFVDITDSSNIHEVGWVPSTDTASFYNEWHEMKVYSHYAYLVSEVQNSGVQIVDLQYLPDSVHYVGKYVPAGHVSTHSIQQSGPYLYLNGCNVTFGQGTMILDLTSNPQQPVLRGGFNNKYVHDCRVVNDTIFAANIYASQGGTISVINAANKDLPVLVNSWVNNPSPGPHNCAITGDRKYCLVTDEIGGNPRLLKIWNISDLNNVIQVATWQPTGITTSVIHNVEVNGNYAVVAHYAAGIRVVDIHNPSQPVEVAWYDTYPSGNQFDYVGCWGVFMFPSGKIIGSDMQTGLYVIKTTIPAIGINSSTGEVPKDYRFEQNFPNPFNPSTTISFSLPKGAYVTLRVFNSVGQLVSTVADGFEYPGEHKLNFDGSKLPSGVYFYRFTAHSPDGNRFTQSKRMVLVK